MDRVWQPSRSATQPPSHPAVVASTCKPLSRKTKNSTCQVVSIDSERRPTAARRVAPRDLLRQGSYPVHPTSLTMSHTELTSSASNPTQNTEPESDQPGAWLGGLQILG
ncbi:hypothetical protein B0T21DRAFT_361768, partial [Apiosordaria backusii]